MEFKTRMIRVKGNPVSEAYANHVKGSWYGFRLRMFDAVTPETLHLQSGLYFKKKDGSNDYPTDTEKACFYSQYNLWKKCAIEDVPILVLEHDAILINRAAIVYNPYVALTYFGQHSMEAVMYQPDFCRYLLRYLENNPVSGPMTMMDKVLSPDRMQQSKYARPHTRYLGPHAPVRCVIDPNVGTSLDHGTKGKTSSRKLDPALWRIIDLSNDIQ